MYKRHLLYLQDLLLLARLKFVKVLTFLGRVQGLESVLKGLEN